MCVLYIFISHFITRPELLHYAIFVFHALESKSLTITKLETNFKHSINIATYK